eukprot:9617836-Heterocapsa_arctica.AAC.1
MLRDEEMQELPERIAEPEEPPPPPWQPPPLPWHEGTERRPTRDEVPRWTRAARHSSDETLYTDNANSWDNS